MLVHDSSSKYKLTVGGYSGTAGDSLTRWYDRIIFTTRDNDNGNNSANCASFYRGGWWLMAA